MKNLLLVFFCLQTSIYIVAQSCNPDVTGPVVSCTGDPIFELVNTGNCDAAIINFQAHVEASMSPTDNCSATTVICSPASGSTFPLGQSTVTCIAYDVAGNSSLQCSFGVDVFASDLYINAGAITDVSCVGAADGAIDATPSGGTPPYSYAWSTGATTQDISGLIPGSYTVTVTDAIGCTYAETRMVGTTADVTDPVVSCTGGGFGVSVNTGSTCNEGKIIFQAIVEASMNATDDCGIDAVICSPASGSVFPLGQTAVVCIAYDFAGNASQQCTFTANVNPPTLFIDAVSGVTDESCAGANDGAIDAVRTGNNFPFSYAWSNGATTEDISGLAPGSYTVTVTDNAGCTYSSTGTVGTIVDVTSPVVSCTGPGFFEIVNAGNCDAAIINFQADVEASMMATDNCGVSAIICSPTSGSSFPLGSTTVTCNALDLAGNVSLQCSFGVEVYSSDLYINAGAITDESCAGVGDGAIDATPSGGIPPYSYAWSNGAMTQDISGLVPGSYTVTVTDAIGCTYSETRMVGTTVDTTSPVVSCTGDPIFEMVNTGNCDAAIVNFQAHVEASMMATDNCGVTATICSPASGSNFPLGSTTVICNALDLAGNVSLQCSFGVEVYSSDLYINAGAITDESCAGVGDGAIDATPSGGIPPYSYAWSNGAMTQDISGLVPGSYTVTVTDAIGCTYSETRMVSTITDNTNPIVSCTGPVFVFDADEPYCSGTVVHYQALAEASMSPTDDCGIDYVLCSIASGSTFLVGSHTVTCQAYDLSGNPSAQCTFTVEVQPCYCPDNRIFPSAIVTNQYYAKQTITAYGTVGTGAAVEFRAGQHIEMTAGFEVAAQAVYLAEIFACN